MDLGGRMVDDWLLAGDLAGAVEAFAPSAQRFAAAAEAAVDRWGERGWFASEHHDLLQHHSLAEAGAAHLGSDASGRLIESFASRILRRGANDVIAALHRKIWLPLFWPSTAAAAFSGAPYVRPERPFATVRERGMSGLVDELVARVGAASTVEVRHVGNLVGLESDGPLTTCAFSDGTVVRSARPVLGVGARELFAAVGIELDLDPAHSSLGWVELPDGASAPDVWWVAAEDRPVFRASTSRPADSPPVVCCELAWWVDDSELGTEAAAAIADALPVGRAELELLQLAGGRAGQLVAELDRGRALVVGEASRHHAIRSASVLATLARRHEHHEGLHRLAPLVVGHADHRHLGDVGWLNSASSTSIELTFSPPVMITSFLRSLIVTYPSSSIVPPSPVWNQPSLDRLVGRRRGCPSSRAQHDVAAREHLALVVDPSRTPSAGAPARPSLPARSAGSRSSHSARRGSS
jgi:hypothetical protein